MILKTNILFQEINDFVLIEFHWHVKAEKVENEISCLSLKSSAAIVPFISFERTLVQSEMGITASRDDLCNRDLSQKRKIEELQYRVIEYQRIRWRTCDTTVPKSLGGRVISEQPQCLPPSVPSKRYSEFNASRRGLEGLNGPLN